MRLANKEDLKLIQKLIYFEIVLINLIVHTIYLFTCKISCKQYESATKVFEYQNYRTHTLTLRVVRKQFDVAE